MKNYVNRVFIALIVTNLFLVSCQKDFETIENTTTTHDANIKVLHYTNANARGGTTSILEFRNMDSFRATLAQLEYDVEKQDDDFIALYGHLDEEAINAKDAEIGFDDTKPLKDFEDSLGFTSLLEDYQAVESIWLQQEELDEETAPEKQFYDLDEEELTLLNKDRAVKIGMSIFVEMHGGLVEITSGSFDTLGRIAYYDHVDDINANDYDDVNVDYDNDNSSPNCAINKTKRKNWSYNGQSNRRIRGVTKFISNSSLWGTKFKSKTRSMKRTLYGVWRGYRTNLKAALDGYYDLSANSTCGDEAHHFDEDVDYTYRANKKKAKFVQDYSPNDWLYVQPSHVMGIHTVYSQRETQYAY